MMSTANDASLTKSENDRPSIVAILGTLNTAMVKPVTTQMTYAAGRLCTGMSTSAVNRRTASRQTSEWSLSSSRCCAASGPPARRRNAAEFTASAVYPLPTSESLRAVAMSPARSDAIKQMLMGAGETIPPARYRSIRKEATASSPPRIVL